MGGHRFTTGGFAMRRRAALRLLAGGACTISFTGCVHDGTWSIEKLLGWDDKPKAPKFTPALLQVSQRVEELGRRIIAQNTFTGLDPLFHTIGVSESVLFHRSSAELFISEGLVNKCKTEAELAAVICSELGAMMAEKRGAIAAGRDRDSIPDAALPGSSMGADGTRAAEVARQEVKTNERRDAAAKDATEHARNLLRCAGFNPLELDRVETLIRQSDRGEILRKQMAGSAAAPTWIK
jgi:hypothetical protein